MHEGERMIRDFRDWTDADIAAHQARVKGAAGKLPSLPSPEQVMELRGKGPQLMRGLWPIKKSGGPNKTETEYAFRLTYEFPHYTPKFEAVTIHLENGHAYTPDWLVALPDGNLLFVEVKARGKSGYRQPSYQRAKLAFDQSRVEFPFWKWRWAEKQGGEWTEKNY